jgi:hypothetical protein
MKRLVCFTVLVVLCLSRSAFAANLIENGDFEAPRLDAGPTYNIYSGASLSTLEYVPLDFKWKVASFGWDDYVYHIGTDWNGASGLPGDQSVSISANAILFQDFTTVIGQQYNLNFWYANAPLWWNSADSSKKIINVIGVGSSSLLSETVGHSGSALDNMNFTEYRGSFTADSLSTRLAFEGPSSGYGFVVDNVSVNAATVTPEPASMLLFGLGGLTLAAFKRKKKLI